MSNQFMCLVKLGSKAIGLGSAIDLVYQIPQKMRAMRLPSFLAPTPIKLCDPEQVRINVFTGSDTISVPGGQVIVVLGRTASGKTTLMNNLISTENGKQILVPFCEPEGDIVTDEALLTIIGSIIETALEQSGASYKPVDLSGISDDMICPILELPLLEQMVHPKERVEVLAFDSFRKFLYSEAKSTGAGGVNNEMFTLLTEMNVFAKHTGLTFIVSLNPLLEDDEKLVGLASRVAGSVDTLITLFGSPSDTGLLQGEMTSRYLTNRGAVPISCGLKSLKKNGKKVVESETAAIKLTVRANDSSIADTINKFGNLKEK